MEPNTLFIAGSKGVMAKSTNAGLNWFSLYHSVTENRLNDLHFINSRTGWCAGENGTIVKTTNAGKNWFLQPTNSTADLWSLFFISEKNGWASGEDILKTTNSGVNWTLVSDMEGNISFVDSLYGWSSGNYAIQKTTDGGSTWSTVYDDTYVNDIFFVTRDKGWATVTGWEIYYIINTTDGGLSWMNQDTSFNYFTAMHFISPDKGWIFDSYGKLYSTSNGGLNWSYQQFNNYYTSCIYFLSEQTGWFTAGNRLFKTINGGINWNYSNTVTGISNVHFTSQDTGWGINGNGILIYTDLLTPIFQTTEVNLENYHLQQNYPNPFNSSTRINYTLPVSTNVLLAVYDVTGRVVSTLVNSYHTAGNYNITWNSNDQPSGIYFYRIKAGETILETKRMILLK